MALTYTRLGIDLLATAGSDVRVRVSLSDSTSGFLNDKLVVSNKLTKTINNQNFNEELALDLNESNIDHDLLLNFEAAEHRLQDDLQTTTTTLWSSQKVQDELDGKVNQISPVADNRLLKSVGTTGVDMEQTAITVDDLGNVSGVEDLIVNGDLTVNGTTTSVNSANLEVTDANITVNNGGTQASANLASAGITVEMSDATDAIIGYDSTLTSKFKVGEAGDLREVLTTTHTQALNNKTIDADVNTLSNIELDNFKSSAIDLDDTLATADDTKLPTSLTVKNYVDAAVATKDEASEIIFTPAGNIIATNVQAAIEEVDSEKVATVDFSGLFDTDFAGKTTTDLTEGSNFYFTNTRARDAAVVDSMVENQSNQAPSVSSVKTYIDNSSPAGSLEKRAGDLNLTNTSVPAGQVDAAVTGFAFNGANVRSFKALASVSRTATTDVFEAFELLAVYTGSDWILSYNSVGDASGITFDITALGQVTYTDISTPAGHTDTTIEFRAFTTEV